jgi:hypothetical protein
VCWVHVPRVASPRCCLQDMWQGDLADFELGLDAFEQEQLEIEAVRVVCVSRVRVRVCERARARTRLAMHSSDVLTRARSTT